jgi:glycosyltransferase involved in cell wall biosynthesis
VSYVGTFQLAVRPDDLLAAVAILRKDPVVGADLRVRFVAPLDPQTDQAIRRYGLGDAIERTGLVGHEEAVRQMLAADVLVLVLGPGAESAGILSGKLPEYLAAGRAVLAIVPEGVAADTIRRANAGEVVAPGDVEGIAAALRRLHAAWKSGALPRPDSTVVSEFDRSRNVARLDAALRGIVRPESVNR